MNTNKNQWNNGLRKHLVVLFGVLSIGAVSLTSSIGFSAGSSSDSQIRQMKFKGKICGGCAKSIKEAMTHVPGVEKTEVDLKKSMVTITAKPQVTNAQIDSAIVAAGFQVKGNEISESE